MLTARAIVAHLVAAGVGHVVICPGSRSGPLALALTEAEQAGILRTYVRLDERGAAFYALGMAKALLAAKPNELAATSASTRPGRAATEGGEHLGTGPLVAVVVTSGTAVANLHPAVLEARHGRVPLVVVTADRPHEMRGVGASQTTNQARIFGEAVRFFADVPANGPVGSVVQRAVASAVGHWRLPESALTQIQELNEMQLDWGYEDVDLSPLDWAERAQWGPVHLNVAFRDPLLNGIEVAEPDEELVAAVVPPGGQPPVKVDVGLTPIQVGPGTVVLAGDGGAGAGYFAGEAYLPLLAEPSSGLRTHPLAIGPYKDLLETEIGQVINKVVVFGHPTLSRPVSALLARKGVEVVVVDGGAEWTDVAANATAVYPAVMPQVDRPKVNRPKGGPGEAESLHPGELTADLHRAWTNIWVAAGRKAQEALTAFLVGEERLSAWATCAQVWQQHRADWRAGREPELMIGASAAIRHFDLLAGCWPAGRDNRKGGKAGGRKPRAAAGVDGQPESGFEAQTPQEIRGEYRGGFHVMSNRGLAGIDGTIATAAGLGTRLGRPVRCVVGDLTFLHDAGSLLRGIHEDDVDLDVIVLNDAGGAIFATLEAGDGRTGEHFERFWGTPQDVDIKALAAAYRCRYVRVESMAQLVKALGQLPKGRRVIEVACAGLDARTAGQQMSQVVRDALETLA